MIFRTIESVEATYSIQVQCNFILGNRTETSRNVAQDCDVVPSGY